MDRVLDFVRETAVTDPDSNFGAFGKGKLEIAIRLYKAAKAAGNKEEEEKWAAEVKRVYAALKNSRQEACHHEFFKGQTTCCRCGITKTPETERLAKERSPKRRKKSAPKKKRA